jgi:phosphatidylglycerol:prolipoprotein diacylglycerol transferase
MILGIIGFAILWNLRKRPWPDGRLFALYLMVSSIFRFSIEFLRLNPRLFFGLSEAQLISIPLFLLGIAGFRYLGNTPRTLSPPAK